MTVDADQPESEEETIKRHQRIIEVMSSERDMTWDDWSLFIHDPEYLTPPGKKAILWAGEILKKTFTDDFFPYLKVWLQKWNETHPDLPQHSHPVFSYGLWPLANRVPWVFANLFNLAAHIQLFLLDNEKRAELNLPDNKIIEVLEDIRENPEPIQWTSSLIQLEVAGLGMRAGWQVQFEPKHRDGKKADVLLTNNLDQLLVETTVMRMSEAERKTLSLSHELSMYLFQVQAHYNVQISGWLSSANLKDTNDRVECLQAIVAAAQTTAQNGSSNQVVRRGQALLTIFRPTEESIYDGFEIRGDIIGKRLLKRLRRILREKNKQAKESIVPVWLRIEERAEMWQYLRMQGWTLGQIRDFFANFLQNELPSFPHLAGVILSPGLAWSTSLPLKLVVDPNETNESIVISCPIQGGSRIRESIIVNQAGKFSEQARLFADWYSQEDTWLDWALETLGKLPFDKLVHHSA